MNKPTPIKTNILTGKKTYLVAGLMLAYAIGGMGLGHLEPSSGFPILMEALAIIGLRIGIAKAEV